MTSIDHAARTNISNRDALERHLNADLNPGPDQGFHLFETMLVTPNQHVRYVERHLTRLAQSAMALGFDFNREQVRHELDSAVVAMPAGVASRLRLELAPNGRVAITNAPMRPLNDGPVDLLIESQPLSGTRPMSAHKTTLREEYDAGVARAERRGAFDSLFFTADGRLVEGGRSNVFALVDGHWWTPPIADGALPGIMRGLLLEDPAWQAGERTLRLSDLRRARSLMVCNALRGAVPGRLVIDL